MVLLPYVHTTYTYKFHETTSNTDVMLIDPQLNQLQQNINLERHGEYPNEYDNDTKQKIRVLRCINSSKVFNTGCTENVFIGQQSLMATLTLTLTDDNF